MRELVKTQWRLKQTLADLPARIRGGRLLSYLAFKVVHLLGVVLFLGNIIVTGVWKTLAEWTREPLTIAYAQRLVTITDWVFTVGGIVLILIGAYGMVAAAGLDPLGTPWLLWGQGLFIASGIIWALILIPTQITQARMARAFAHGSSIPTRYWRLSRRWMIWGTIATLLPLANLYVMVVKP
jgi:uncharacterized membrane protein